MIKYNDIYYIITVNEIITPTESSLSTSTPNKTIISLSCLLLENKENNLILQYHKEFKSCSYSLITNISDKYFIITIGRELYLFKLDGEYENMILKDISYISCVADVVECEYKNSVVFIKLYTDQRMFYSFNEKNEELALLDNYEENYEDKSEKYEISEPKFLLIKE